MPRPKRITHEDTTYQRESRRIRDLLEEQRLIWKKEEEYEYMQKINYELAEALAQKLGITTEQVMHELELALEPIEEQVWEELRWWIMSPLRAFIEGFIHGFRVGLHNVLNEWFQRFMRWVEVQVNFRIRYKPAWVWRGFLVQAWLDGIVFRTVVEDHPEVLEFAYNSARFANRYVRLRAGLEGYIKAFAHEYLSYLRPFPCHQSSLMIKITPLTLRVAKGKKGTVYVAVNLESRVLSYSPYSFKATPQIGWFGILNRRKGRSEVFSLKHEARCYEMVLDAKLATGIDEFDEPCIIRTVRDVILLPHLVTKDKAISLGFPERRFDIKHCSVYFIPERKTVSRKMRNYSTMLRLDTKWRIYKLEKIL